MDLEKYLGELLVCVKKVSNELKSKKNSSLQYSSDLEAGMFRDHSTNTLVPFASHEHNIALEAYETYVLEEAYLALANRLFENPQERLGYFTLRILYEVGFTRIDMLFAEEVSEPRREKFKLMDTLCDMASMQEAKYHYHFLRLLADRREEIDNELLKNKLEEIESFLLEDINSKIPLRKIKKLRGEIQTELYNITKPVALPPMLEGKTNFPYLKAALSHLMHGNPTMVRVALHPSFSKANTNHILTLIWNTAINILFRTKPFISNKELLEEIEALLTKSETAWQVFQTRRTGY